MRAKLLTLFAVVALLLSAAAPAAAQGPNKGGGANLPHQKHGKITQADRKAAAANAKAAGFQAGATAAQAAATQIPDYFGAANWAFTPTIPKFVDSLAGLTPGGANNVDQDPVTAGTQGAYIPLAQKDTTSYPGSEYYEIGLVQFCHKFSSNLPATLVRGYVQISTASFVGKHVQLTNAVGCDATSPAPVPIPGFFGVDDPQYLGPIIVATGGTAATAVPVRVKFSNLLPTGSNGDLFIPVDTTVMGSGAGPLAGQSYSQNRATLHLHGGNTPWISDGTQHQWITPAGETTAYPEGVAVENVPGMTGCGSPTDGCQTFFYTNQQSARLLFYHDHAYGITRLNVYAGEAAGYLVKDANADTMAGAVGIDPVGIPLVIQDKTFVDAATIGTSDPTWAASFGSTPGTARTGDLWLPHVYMPNQNPYDISGANAFGRWDYGPWFWPPFTGITQAAVPNPYCSPTPPAPGSTEANPGTYDCSATPWEPPFIPGTPNPSIVPEAFMDTPVVNGTAYPTLSVPAGKVRLRVLNAANDRYWNLSLWTADPGSLSSDGRANTEVKMVPFNSSQNATAPFPAAWYDHSVPNPFDDRVGGVPDPATRGPAMIQIGDEAGLLAAPAVLPNQPINFVMNKRDITVGNVAPNQHTLFLGPAERADVVVDFTNFSGKTLILYNDSPAPVPAADSRFDYFTGDPDQSATGGAASTAVGFGPNTRTIMQINVAGGGSSTAPVDDYDPAFLTTLTAAVQTAYAASQPKPLVPNAVYNGDFTGASYPADSYARISSNNLNVQGTAVSSVTMTNGGAGYTSPPTVGFNSTTGSGAQATAVLATAGVATVSLSNTGGFGYTAAPAVTFSGGGGSNAAATANLGNAGVRTVTITNGGSGYLQAPTVTFSPAPPGGTTAAGTATVRTTGARNVTAITITNPGSGYLAPPGITFTPVSGGSGAAATSNMGQRVVSFTVTNAGANYTSAPSVTVAAPPSANCAPTSNCTAATAASALLSRPVQSVTVTNGGSGYLAAPTVSFTGGGGANAAATASLSVKLDLQPKSIIENFDQEYGRMNALLGVEIANTTGINQTSIPYGDVDPATEVFTNSVSGSQIGTLGDGTQIWKITHNGVDTHAIHWHMFDVQIVNRVGWDGAIRPPEANEIGWKDTIRMNPLEDIIVALRPIVPTTPFKLPNSIRPLDVANPLGVDMNIGAQLGGALQNPQGLPVTVNNQLVNFGYEFVWHCHLLGHEENIMMRSILVANRPDDPTAVTVVKTGSGGGQRATVSWTDNSANETGWVIQRATGPTGSLNPTSGWTTVSTVNYTLAKDVGLSTGPQSQANLAVVRGAQNFFRVTAINVVGLTQTPATGFPTATAQSSAVAGNGIAVN